MQSAIPALQFDTACLPADARCDVVRIGVGAAFDLRLNGTAPADFHTSAITKLACTCTCTM